MAAHVKLLREGKSRELPHGGRLRLPRARVLSVQADNPCPLSPKVEVGLTTKQTCLREVSGAFLGGFKVDCSTFCDFWGFKTW